MDVHSASSNSWNSTSDSVEACARLCQLAVQSNTGIAQMVIDNSTELLDLMTVEELQAPDDDLGLSTAFLAIYYNRPDCIAYLHKRGVDFSAFCDPMSFGTPYFYAVSLTRYEIVALLDTLGYSVALPCDSFGQTPLQRAAYLGDIEMKDLIIKLNIKRNWVLQMMIKNCLRYLCWIRYRKIRNGLLCIQRIVRGYWGRKLFRKRRKEKKMGLKKEKLQNKKNRNKKY